MAATTSDKVALIWGPYRYGPYEYLYVNAQRIVACVHACEGIPTEALEAGVIRGGEGGDSMERIIEELRKLRPLEPGEDRALVFDDTVVIASFSSETAELKLKIVVGYHRIEGDAFPEEA